MGADGYLYVMKVEDFKKKFPNMNPNDCGFYEGNILGINVFKEYIDSERDFDYHIYTPEQSSIREWFFENAEKVLCYT